MHAIEALNWTGINQLIIEHPTPVNRRVGVEIGYLKDRVKSLTVKLECICGEALDIHVPFFSGAARKFIADTGSAKGM